MKERTRSSRFYAIFLVTLMSIMCVGLLGGAARVNAHADGASFEKQVGGYVIDVGYSPVSFVAHESVVLDFRLSDDVTKEAYNFKQVWVRITQDRSTLLATGVSGQVLGPSTLLYSFPQGGDYTLEVSFRNENDEDIAAASFPISVQVASEGESGYLVWGIVFLAGLILGIFGFAAWQKVRH